MFLSLTLGRDSAEGWLDLSAQTFSPWQNKSGVASAGVVNGSCWRSDFRGFFVWRLLFMASNIDFFSSFAEQDHLISLKTFISAK